MKKTIEERAKEIAIEYPQQCTHSYIVYAYMEGAKDQKQIDIEKACEWLETITSEEVIEEFREAMEK